MDNEFKDNTVQGTLRFGARHTLLSYEHYSPLPQEAANWSLIGTKHILIISS